MRTKVGILVLALTAIGLSGCLHPSGAQPAVQPGRMEAMPAAGPAAGGAHLVAYEASGETATGLRRAVVPPWPDTLPKNPFDVLLGLVQTPGDCSVRPCSGEAPSLCIYRGTTLVGTVVLETTLLASKIDLKEMLAAASIPLGSVDYTDPQNGPQLRRALSAQAGIFLDDLAQQREPIYRERGYRSARLVPEDVAVGSLAGVAYGFTGTDRQGSVVERRLTYAALDNHRLYEFTVFYADGADGSFLSDEDLVRFEPYLRQILVRLRLPVSEDWHAPGAELPQGPLLLVQRPDDSIQITTPDGLLSAVLVAEAPSSLLPAGFSGVTFGGTPMMDGPIVYVRQWFGGFYALDTILGQLFLLEFVPPASLVAVRPLTEEALPDGAPLSLAWGEFSADVEARARLHVAAPDGSEAVPILRETYGGSDPWSLLLPWRWSTHGKIFFTKQQVEGMGGFRPFAGAANLWLLDPQSGESVELVSQEITGGRLCLDAISDDDRLVAHHCREGEIRVLDLESGDSTGCTLPDQATADLQLGSVQFSPDESRIAFALVAGGYELIDETRGYVAVSDNLRLSTNARVIAESDPGTWYSIAAWLSDDRLVLQSHSAGPAGWPAVWIVRSDGSGLLKLLDGTFLATLGG